MYTVALFSPGRNHAGLVGRDMDFEQAAENVKNIILGQFEDRTPSKADERSAEREGLALVAYAPSSITLHDGHRVTIDR